MHEKENNQEKSGEIRRKMIIISISDLDFRTRKCPNCDTLFYWTVNQIKIIENFVKPILSERSSKAQKAYHIYLYLDFKKYILLFWVFYNRYWHPRHRNLLKKTQDRCYLIWFILGSSLFFIFLNYKRSIPILHFLRDDLRVFTKIIGVKPLNIHNTMHT